MKIDWNNNPSILNNYLNYLLGVCSYSIDTVEDIIQI